MLKPKNVQKSCWGRRGLNHGAIELILILCFPKSLAKDLVGIHEFLLLQYFIAGNITAKRTQLTES